MQKNRWPFFFFEGLPFSLVTLSLSEPSLSSSSSPICTSSVVSTDCVDVCDCPLLMLLLVDGVSLSSREDSKGEEGKGRWPGMPTKLLRVGVFREGSSALTSSAAFESFWKRGSGRGVVGVVSSPERPGGGSGTVRVVLTAWKLDMAGWGSTYGVGAECRRRRSTSGRGAVVLWCCGGAGVLRVMRACNGGSSTLDAR